MDQTAIVTRIKMRIAVVVFGVLGIFLFSSEFMNAVFNNKLDAQRHRRGYGDDGYIVGRRPADVPQDYCESSAVTL